MLAPVFIAQLQFNVRFKISKRVSIMCSCQKMQQLFISVDKCSLDFSVISHWEIVTLNLCNAIEKQLIYSLHFLCALFECSQLIDTLKYKPSL